MRPRSVRSSIASQAIEYVSGSTVGTTVPAISGCVVVTSLTSRVTGGGSAASWVILQPLNTLAATSVTASGAVTIRHRIAPGARRRIGDIRTKRTAHSARLEPTLS